MRHLGDRQGGARTTQALAAAAAGGLLALSAATGAQAQPAQRPAQGTVIDHDVRFQVLTPTLVRMEYAKDGRFEDRPTVNAVQRDFSPPAYTARVENGYRVIRTSGLTLRYRLGSGPFTQDNTEVRLTAGDQLVTGHPQFGESTSTCTFGAVCDTEYGTMSGGAKYTSPGQSTKAYGRGVTAGYEQAGAASTVRVSNVPADGRYTLRLRYSNAKASDGRTTDRTLSVEAGGRRQQVTMTPSGDWEKYQVSEPITVELKHGIDDITVAMRDGDTGKVNIDAFALTRSAEAAFPTPATKGETSNLGGWTRGLDNTPSAPYQLNDGVLSRDGWYLLDDSATALSNGDGQQPTPRRERPESAYQDGYLFGYGHDYKQGLRDLQSLTGPAPLLPRWAFGLWFSRWHAYSAGDYKELLAQFRSHKVPLDALVVDTDYKGSGWWNGWTGWNKDLFPDPDAFMKWAKDNGLPVVLNTHPSIDASDPAFPRAMRTANGQLSKTPCNSGADCYGFDWSDPNQAKAFFDLHKPYDAQGVRLWWNDWCCDASLATGRGITPDTLISQLYAAHTAEATGLRGFAFSRIGASYQRLGGGYPSGPWADHRSTMHFTGDSSPTWETLAFAAGINASEGNIGLPYVSHDIGSFHGEETDKNPELYARWMQLGAFSPIDRIHSGGKASLPWEFGGEAGEAGEKFDRLRGALTPYFYSLARESTRTGLPMARPLYLNYPEQKAAYEHSTQYTLGDDVLVAPVTEPGGKSTLWVPPGTWTDYFTGKTYTGPKSVHVTTPLDEMPVLIRSGGILPQQDYKDYDAKSPMDHVTLTVGSSGHSSFPLYEDAGDGMQYSRGEHATTTIRTAGDTLTVSPQQGTYPDRVTSRSWTLSYVNAERPRSVTVNGKPVKWTYDSAKRTLTVKTAQLPTDQRTVIKTRR
ncbi:TIM-barrel domain-containing protein [Streptomyces sp. NBC_01306]|uniref:TIM-barrel domain-containing protein n=1 Tax=Streptomyces sp. NBC_01306 TaxID=2903819 RepID=UPI002256E184|nr:TIM-barrel domain-containing protein [Streptomyces sp. NBC_01306]MCX4722309.1 DUF5110 domain-containing protein [Streptomyces sp. NBC_01306]